MSDYLNRMFSLQGKTAVVTGASRGIGLAIANGLAQAGAYVLGVARTPTRPAGLTEGTHYRPCDVSREDALSAMFVDVMRDQGRLDLLVNAAGVSTAAAADVAGELRRFDQTISVNLRAVFAACLMVEPHMRSGGGGAIVNITSINSVVAFPGNPGYVAAKGGARMLTRSLAMDFAASNIRVNAVAPGYIRTDMTRHSYQDPALRAQREARMILPRYGEPDDVVGAVLYLMSPAASYVTGQDLFVDGGWTAKGL